MKRISGFLLAAVFITTSVMFSACGNKTSDTTTVEKSTAAQVSTVQEKIDPLGKYSEPVDVTAVLGFRPPESTKVPKDITPETQSWVTLCKDVLNINMKFLWTVPSEQYEQKFGVAMASGEISDILVLGQKEYENLHEAGQLTDLTELYDKYASTRLKQFVEADGGVTLNSMKREGKVYGIPNYMDPKQFAQMLWIREDWLKKLNMQAPKTIDELEKLAEAFVNNDPDGNGKKDTLGLGIQKKPVYWGFDIRGLFHGFGAYPTKWIKDSSGNLVAGEIQPQVKDALAKVQTMFKNGLIDKEFATKDENKVVEDVVSGKIGLVYGEWWYPNWPLNMTRDKNPNAEWKCYAIPSVDGSPAKTAIDRVGINWIISVNAKCKNPEAIIKMLNLNLDLDEKKYGKLATEEGGYVYNWVPSRLYYPMMIDNIYKISNEALKENKAPEAVVDPFNTGAESVYKSSKEWLDSGKDFSKWGQYFSRVAQDGGWSLTKKTFDSGNVTYNEFYGPITPTQQEKGAYLEKMLDETFDKIIMGGNLSEFDTYVANWKKLGGDEITKEVNDWYKNNVK